MRISKTRRLQVEALECKTLLTAYALAAPVRVAAMVGLTSAQHPIPLGGAQHDSNPALSHPIIGDSSTMSPSLGSGGSRLPSQAEVTGTSGPTRLTTAGLTGGGSPRSYLQAKPTGAGLAPSQKGPTPSPGPFRMAFEAGVGQVQDTAGSGKVSPTPSPNRGGLTTRDSQSIRLPFVSNEHTWGQAL